MRWIAILPLFMLMSCANSSTEVEHTVDIIGAADPTDGSATASPATLKVKLKELWVGEAADCSDLQIIRRLATSGVQTEIYSNPNQTIISARPITISSVQCIAIKMTDSIAFTPNSVAAGTADCTLGIEATFDIFNDNSKNNREPNVASDDDLNNDFITGDAAVEQDVWLYFSVAAPAFTVNAGQRTAMTTALNLENPYKIVLYANYSGKVSSSSGKCVLSDTNLESLSLGVE